MNIIFIRRTRKYQREMPIAVAVLLQLWNELRYSSFLYFIVQKNQNEYFETVRNFEISCHKRK